MAYIVVEDFRYGMDRRRERVAGVPGTLWLGKDVHVTRGADLERRKKFTADYHVPGTFGCYALRSQLYVFGSDDLASSMPIGIRYQRLQAPSGAAMEAVLDVKAFSGKLYVVAEYVDGNIHHYLDGTRVTDWDAVAEDGASFETVASALAEKIESNGDVTAFASGSTLTVSAKVAGEAFTITKAATDGGGTDDQDITLATTQANVVPVAEVRASAEVAITGGSADPDRNTISSVKINGVELLSAPLAWSGSNASTAILLASAIVNGYGTHGYSAAAVDDAVTISAAPGTGATPNGYEIIVTATGDVSVDADAALAGGVTAVAAAQQVVTATLSGTFEVDDTFALTVNGVTYKVTGLASGMGRSLYVAQKRIWSPVGSVWRYCMLDRGDIWDPDNATQDNDSGFINIASETDGNEKLVVAARYQSFAAIFSQSSVTLFQLDTDPANFAVSDFLENTGTLAPDSVVRYGNNDVFYLDITGIRSLRARDASNAPFVSDVGNAIDTFVQEYVDSLPQQRVRASKAAIEPRDGRLWLAIGDRIFVLSFFPGAKISAWTYYSTDEFDGADVQSLVRLGKRLHVRAGDYIYTYGGLDGATYPEDDEVVGQVELPFLAGKTAGTIKGIRGFDIAATNTWEVSVAFDPNREDKTINVGNMNKITFADPESVNMAGETSMLAPILTCRKGGAATISMLALHYEAEAAS